MALRWRIRHKILLGFGLVIATIGLLLAGTFYGLWSYRSSMRAVDFKLLELAKADHLRDEIKHLSKPTKGLGNEGHLLNLKLKKVRQRLDEYAHQLDITIDETLKNGDDCYEKIVVQGLRDQVGILAANLAILTDPGHVVAGSASSDHLINDPKFKEPLAGLTLTADDLREAIRENLGDQRKEARDIYWFVLYWVIGISAVSVLGLAVLLRRFYCWIVNPIRDLQAGAERVAQGDFEHRIAVNSGDEMEMLAAQFNHMTDELHASYSDLERQVNERSRQLVRSERLASVGFLAAGVAHEINNPLASIAFCSEALESRLQDLLAEPDPHTLPMRGRSVSQSDRETIEKYLKMVQDEAFRCKAITQRLLEFSRSGEGHRERVDLNETVQSVLEIVQHLQNGRDKNLVFEPRTQPSAWVNAQEIKSVVLNLVVNALESMGEGGTLTITHQVVEGMAEITFSDTGCGMTEDVLENIFEPFFTRSRTGKGTGLGLSISHRVINEHGGEIEAFSPGPNRGSTFVVRLPLQAPADKNAPTEADAPEIEPEPTHQRRLAA